MKGRSLLVAGIALLLSFAANPWSHAQPTDARIKLTEKEILLAELPAGIDPKSVVVSPDAKHAAYVQTQGGQQVVMLDGAAGKSYAGIIAESLQFSPDSQHLLYVASRTGKTLKALSEAVQTNRTHYCAISPGDKVCLVVDGQEQKEYEAIDLQSLLFSPDSQRLAYVALPPARRSEGKKSVVVVDDNEGAIYRDILAPLAFSPDGKHIAYRAFNRKGEAIVVVDGVEGTAYQNFPDNGLLRFHSNTSLVTLAHRGNRIYRIEIEISEL